VSKTLRKQLDDAAAKRGVTFIIDSGGVILEPAKCPECKRWGARPDHCEHVDHNVGVMVRCVLEGSEGTSIGMRADAAWLGITREYGDTTAEALARLLLKLWESATVDT
jgi:hypothetical protein